MTEIVAADGEYLAVRKALAYAISNLAAAATPTPSALPAFLSLSAHTNDNDSNGNGSQSGAGDKDTVVVDDTSTHHNETSTSTSTTTTTVTPTVTSTSKDEALIALVSSSALRSLHMAVEHDVISRKTLDLVGSATTSAFVTFICVLFRVAP
jgi:hypothetical protein